MIQDCVKIQKVMSYTTEGHVLHDLESHVTWPYTTKSYVKWPYTTEL